MQRASWSRGCQWPDPDWRKLQDKGPQFLIINKEQGEIKKERGEAKKLMRHKRYFNPMPRERIQTKYLQKQIHIFYIEIFKIP